MEKSGICTKFDFKKTIRIIQLNHRRNQFLENKKIVTFVTNYHTLQDTRTHCKSTGTRGVSQIQQIIWEQNKSKLVEKIEKFGNKGNSGF